MKPRLLLYISLISVGVLTSCFEDDDDYNGPSQNPDKITRLAVTQSNFLMHSATDTSALFYSYLTDFDLNDYPGVDSVKLVLMGAYHMGQESGPGIIALYDLTNGKLIDGSKVKVTSAGAEVSLTSANFKQQMATGRIDFALYTNNKSTLWGSYVYLYRH